MTIGSLWSRIRAEWATPMTRVVFALVMATAVMIWWLERFKVVATEPLWLLLVVLGVGYLLCWTAHLYYLARPSPARFHLRIATQVTVATIVMYLTGWGPALTLGFVIVARDNLTVAQGHPWRPIAVWIAVGLVAGQVAISLRIAPSFVTTPDEYGLATLSALATLFVIGFLGISAEHLFATQESLRLSEERLRTTLETANDAYVEIDDHGAVTEWNGQAEAIFGWSREDAIGQLLERLIIPGDQRAAHRSGLQRVATDGASTMLGRHLELTARHRDGHAFPVELAIWKTPAAHGSLYHAFAHDITRRKDAETALLRSQQDFRMLFAHHPHPMWVYDLRSLCFVEVNEAALDHYGYSRDEFLSMTIEDIRLPEDVAVLAAHLAATREELEHTGVWRHRTKDGAVIDVDISSHRLVFDGRDCALVMAQDVSAQRRLEDQLRHQALHDTLTGLPNRALLLDRSELLLAQSRRAGSQMAALFLDLDNFKEVNDSLGHLVGDELLQAVATRVFTAIREADTVARIGGDEFVVLVGNASTSSTSPELVADHLLHVIRDTPFYLGGRNVTVTASIGIATGDTCEAADLIRNADVALYQAKARGKNRSAFFLPEMGSAVNERLEMALDLQSALANSQFELHYQPVVDLRNLALMGSEALLRWRHPTLGWVSPERFIPLAEETGVIDDIGRWVLDKACSDAAAWRPSYPWVSVAINVSAAQLSTDRFVDDVRNALTRNQLDPEAIVLEITESTLMVDANATVRRLQTLKSLGVRLAIDDFGTGFSSLSYLRQFPVDILKIDRSFLSTVTTSVQTAVLVHSLVQLGKALGLEVIAEGIEHPDQLEALRDTECRLAQGFLFAQAVPKEEIDRLLECGYFPDPEQHADRALQLTAGDGRPYWLDVVH